MNQTDKKHTTGMLQPSAKVTRQYRGSRQDNRIRPIALRSFHPLSHQYPHSSPSSRLTCNSPLRRWSCCPCPNFVAPVQHTRSSWSDEHNQRANVAARAVTAGKEASQHDVSCPGKLIRFEVPFQSRRESTATALGRNARGRAHHMVRARLKTRERC